ncbi:hypothetical protein QO002_002929 [Pararhizobium capsulatum DSM 1112]|uniref:Uncharacterized protein n=1 Tax=Pararhizobium capsulatum DSM 1112 TaxID=1121113 RepID=A0ABU0BRA7_9HYPH|nr:hypothetical protein [Pararhizobium capsulatum DSM 1112]
MTTIMNYFAWFDAVILCTIGVLVLLSLYTGEDTGET